MTRLELTVYLAVVAALWWMLPSEDAAIRTPRQPKPPIAVTRDVAQDAPSELPKAYSLEVPKPAPKDIRKALSKEVPRKAPKGPLGTPTTSDQGSTEPRYFLEDDSAKRNATGTAFALDDGGLWITARHVAGGCETLGFLRPGQRTIVPAKRVWIHPHSDLALVQGPQARHGFKLSSTSADRGSNAFHVGFPQGKPGDVWSRVIGPARMVVRGRYRSEEPVVAYAEVERYPSFSGGLGGISGGPILDASGRIIGVSVALNPRRGRIIGTAPRSFDRLFDEALRRPRASETASPTLTPTTLQGEGDALRQSFSVAMLYCFVD